MTPDVKSKLLPTFHKTFLRPLAYYSNLGLGSLHSSPVRGVGLGRDEVVLCYKNKDKQSPMRPHADFYHFLQVS